MLASNNHLPNPHISHPTYRPDIDGLRAVAVILVIIHHAFPDQLKGGFIGVDLFFVISGFLISTIIFQNLENNTFSFIDFYKRRAKRIFPALSIVLITSFIYGWFILLPGDYKQLGKHILAGAAFVSNFAFWNESGYFEAGSKLKPLLHLWSLGIEEQYYIFWPVIVYFLWRKKFNLLKICFVLLIISFLINIITVKSNVSAAFYSPFSRFWELLMGSILAYIKLRRSNAPQVSLSNNVMAWGGAFLLLLGVTFLNPERRFPGFWALFPTIAAYLLINAGPKAWFNHMVLSNKTLVWLGLISFPLYLWHWPLLVFAEIHEGKTPSIEIRLTIIAASILLAWLTYRLIERPIRFGKNYKKTPYYLYGVLALTALTGTYTYARDGFDFRFPKIIRALTDNKTPIIDGWRENTCILEVNHPPTEYAENCVDKNRHPLLFLWGDSHAAALYPGIKKLQDEGIYKFGIGQRNGAICPPLLGDPRPWCKALNDDSFRLIEKIKPDIVFLYAHWARGINDQGAFQGEYDLNLLEPTVIALKKLGIKKIIIQGPTPYWKNDLPKIILAEWKKGSALQRPPLYMKQDLVDGLQVFEATMQAFSARLGVSYISALKILCNNDGCQTRNGEYGEKVSSVDYGHLTADASARYIKSVAQQIFKMP